MHVQRQLYSLILADIVLLYFYVDRWPDLSQVAHVIALCIWLYLAVLHVRLIRQLSERRKVGETPIGKGSVEVEAVNGSLPNEAKELFMKYDGSFFHMDREGDYERYKSFGVSRELEEAWTEELRNELLTKIAVGTDGPRIRMYVGALVDLFENRGGDAQVLQMLAIIRSKVGNMDSLSQVVIAESIARLVDSCEGKHDAIIPSAVAAATEILAGLLKGPVAIAQEDQADEHAREAAQPHRILERAGRCLLRLKRYPLPEAGGGTRQL